MHVCIEVCQHVYILIYTLILAHYILYLHLAFPTWLLRTSNLCAITSVLLSFSFSVPFFSWLLWLRFLVTSLFFVFCFVFPQGRESFWKCRVICFVQQISCHACTVYLASFNSPSKYCFLLVITFTFSSSQLDGWGWDLFLFYSLLCRKCIKEYLACSICLINKRWGNELKWFSTSYFNFPYYLAYL